MQAILIPITIGAFMAVSAFATGENIPTSKNYVDTEIAPKQDKIAANDGTTQVLTNTGTSGEYGTKNIYDSTASYGGQSESLIDAVTMNTAVQNAINTEFQCIEYNPNDPTDCWIMDVLGTPPKRSPNLFDVSKIVTHQQNGTLVNNNDGSITVTAGSSSSAISTLRSLSVLAPEIIAGETYILSFKTTGKEKNAFFYCYGHTGDNWTWQRNKSKLITENMMNCTMYFYASGVGTTATIRDIQIERGTTATPYQPYGNIYLPTETQ